MKPQKLSLISLLATMLLIAACTTVPLTGRKQFMVLPEGYEQSLGLTAYEQVLGQSKLSNDPKQNEMLQRVGARIAAAADKPNYKWEFKLIQDDKTVNAFCLPGGKVAFYTGIMPVCKDENGVAVVMGHEVSHALARHGGERLSQGILADVGFTALNEGMKGANPDVRNGVMAALGLGAQIGVLLPFGRKQESEADRIGLILMSEAGYDPHAAVDFWKRMDQLSEGKSPPQWLSTHPSHETRVRQIEEWMPEAMQHYKPQ